MPVLSLGSPITSSAAANPRMFSIEKVSIAALMNEANSGCGWKGFDFSSGWNCTPTNQGWSRNSTISGSTPSGDIPEKISPAFSNLSL